MRRLARRWLPPRLRGAIGAQLRGLASAVGGPLQPAVPPGSVVAICHCHDASLVPELARCLLALPRGAALHVTTGAPAVEAAWAPYRGRSRVPIAFHAVENRGRDLLPFFEVARGLAIGPDAAVLKLHGKRSGYSGQGEWWRRDLLRGLLPGPFAAGRALERFATDPRLALIGAPGSFIAHPVYWGRNRAAVAEMMGRIAGVAVDEADLGFIAGSMFWIRGAYLSALLPHVDPDLFEPEPIGQDGHYAHALERVVGMAALAWGWRIGETDRARPLDRGDVRERTLGYI